MIKIEGNKWLLTNILLLVIVILVYMPSLNGPFIFDDKPDIVDNDLIKTDILSAAAKNPFRSITYVSYHLNYKISGLSPFGFRLTNVFIHIINVYLLGTLLSSVSKIKYLPRLFAMGFFALSPVATSSVNYISARSTLLAAMFGLISLICFIRINISTNQRLMGILSIILFIFALESKENAAAIAGITAVALILFPGCRKNRISIYVAVGQIVALAAYFILRISYIIDLGQKATDPVTYLINQPKVWLLYGRLILWPYGQNIDHEIFVVTSFGEYRFWVPVVLIGLIFVLLFKFKKAPHTLFYFMFAIIALLPESSLIPLGDLAFEHRAYLSLAGISALLSRAGDVESCNFILKMTFIAVLGFMTAISINRNGVWSNEITIWEDAKGKSPEKSRVRYNLGVSYSENDQSLKAELEYLKALEIEPEKANAMLNLGVLIMKRGKFLEAGALFEKIVKMEPYNGDARLNFGLFLLKTLQIEEAKHQLGIANELMPKSLRVKEALRRALLISIEK